MAKETTEQVGLAINAKGPVKGQEKHLIGSEV